MTRVAVFFFLSCFSVARERLSADQALLSLLAREWQYELRDDPELATVVGDSRYNDRWKDYSLSAELRRANDLHQWLSTFRNIDPATLSEEGLLNRTLIIRNLEERIEAIRLQNYEMPLNPHSGVQLAWVELAGVTPFRDVKDYEDYRARLQRLPLAVDQIVEVLRQGIRDNLVPSKDLLLKTVPQCRAIAAATRTANPFAAPLSHFPAAVSRADTIRLRGEIFTAIDNDVRPSYAKLADFIENTYVSKGRQEPGFWALRNGEARYRFAVRQMTTLAVSPEEIFELGIKEVARIEQAELNLAKQLGFANVQQLRRHVKNDKEFSPQSKDQLLHLYEKYIAQMEPLVPRVTHLTLKSRLEIRSMQSYAERSAGSAKYLQGSANGSRSGVLLINTSDLNRRTTIPVEASAYHEGIPGHHLQIGFALQLDIPEFRREGSFTAFTEGWALYAEQLGKELGFYRNPYSDYGRLSNDLLRAIRLVVDTGVHHKRWTRANVVNYFHEHSSEDEPTVQSETDRYIAQPAQALAYKIGEQRILQLRRESEERLGRRFDLAAFHDEILSAGSIPLDVLRDRVHTWIERQTEKIH